MTWDLLGIRACDEAPTVESNCVVARFDSKALAEDYVFASTLEEANRLYFQADRKRGIFRFRKYSVLRDYDKFDISLTPKPGIPPMNPSPWNLSHMISVPSNLE